MDHIEEGFWARGERDCRGLREGLRRARRHHLGHRRRAAAPAPAGHRHAAPPAPHPDAAASSSSSARRRPRGQRRHRRAQPVGASSSATTGRRSSGWARTRCRTTSRSRTPSRSGRPSATARSTSSRPTTRPHTREEKEPGWTDGWKAHTGTPSAQFYLPLLLDAAQAGPHHARAGRRARPSTAPARVFGLGDKGRLEVGADADLAIVDLDAELEITRRRRPQQDRLDAVRRPARARRRRHARSSAGAVVYDDGTVVGEPGLGPPGRARPASRRTAPGRTARRTDTMTTRFGLLVPHFGERGRPGPADRGRAPRRAARLRLALGARPPRLPSARHGGHRPDVHRAVRRR